MKLPNIFKPKFSYDLIRIGSKHDGGYLIEKSSLKTAEFLLSFGISTNWQFEYEFINKANVDFLAFDGSVNKDFWEKEKKQAINKLKKLSVNKYLRYLYLKFSFNKFFSNNKLVAKFIGSGSNNFLSFKDAILLSGVKKNIFLKIDIEGSEYDILNEILEEQDKIIGLAIEFHYCNKNKNNIINFIKNFKNELVHIHVNNYENFGNNEIPDTLEITFSKSPTNFGNFIGLPHLLDRPNRKKNEEIKITFDE